VKDNKPDWTLQILFCFFYKSRIEAYKGIQLSAEDEQAPPFLLIVV
jgi:hypothetical protein